MKTKVLGVSAPEKPEQYDKKCPFYGEIAVKKETLVGKVIKRDTSHSATIEWFRPYFIPKYERYEVRRSRLRVHNPISVDAQIGQEVLVARTRPLSKTKHHVILTVLSKEEAKKQSKETLEQQKKEAKETQNESN